MDIKKRLKDVPTSPGVYFFLGEGKEVLYIGKASNLKKRVSSYFSDTYKHPKTRALVSKIIDLDYITTLSSEEALIYEANLIKEKKPKYNVELKDGKTYPFLKLTINEKFPRLIITRNKKDDSALYYGPYTNVKLLKKALHFIRSFFVLRTCVKLPKKACLKAHIKQCLAPCDGSISESDYKKIVEETKLFLEGKKGDLIKNFSSEMKNASKEKDYEKAIALRDKIEGLGDIWKGAKPPSPINREVDDLKKILDLNVLPLRIEAFDVSNISGKEAVGSMVSFFSGKPQKDEYRRFRIREISGIDDYTMIKEIIRRRYSRLLKEKENFPDLVVIDGGKGHLRVAGEVLNDIMPGINIISIAKKEEHIYKKGKSSPAILPRRSPALKLVMRIRDEAHRFAISYHKYLRGKSLLHSVLDDIEGIGEKRKKSLIEHFESVSRIKKASIKELKSVKGMTKSACEKVFKYFKKRS